jgi:hypothetical protein
MPIILTRPAQRWMTAMASHDHLYAHAAPGVLEFIVNGDAP